MRRVENANLEPKGSNRLLTKTQRDEKLTIAVERARSLTECPRLESLVAGYACEARVLVEDLELLTSL